jgi:hypothetical protein
MLNRDKFFPVPRSDLDGIDPNDYEEIPRSRESAIVLEKISGQIPDGYLLYVSVYNDSIIFWIDSE